MIEFTFTTTAAVPHMPVSKDMDNPTQPRVVCCAWVRQLASNHPKKKSWYDRSNMLLQVYTKSSSWRFQPRLKNTSQMGWFHQIGIKTRNVWNHQPVFNCSHNTDFFEVLNLFLKVDGFSLQQSCRGCAQAAAAWCLLLTAKSCRTSASHIGHPSAV